MINDNAYQLDHALEYIVHCCTVNNYYLSPFAEVVEFEDDLSSRTNLCKGKRRFDGGPFTKEYIRSKKIKEEEAIMKKVLFIWSVEY